MRLGRSWPRFGGRAISPKREPRNPTVRYVSTRGEAPSLGFGEAMLAGLARDGGLYVPEVWPRLEPDVIAGFAGRPYAEVAVAVMRPFVGDAIAEHDFARMAREAYGNFRHPAVVPLTQLGAGEFVLELFHGPTLAFKDLAMQLLGRLMDHDLAARNQHATIVVATSGDTGGAAIEAFRGRARADLFVLFPHGRVSDVQRRMMTTATNDNVHAIAIEGTFDDCQALAKAMFNHHAFRDRVALSGVNSINWARIAAQVVYYFTAAVALGAPYRKVAFTVPTGNFGDVYAGYVALRMGLLIDRLVIATNVNDILAAHACDHRHLRAARGATHGLAVHGPSRWRPISSAFCSTSMTATRGPVRALMASTRPVAAIRALGAGAPSAFTRATFSADRADAEETAASIRTVLRESGHFIDPHTAVGVAVAEKETRDRKVPMIVLGTAHAAKFPDAMEAACGVRPPLPAWLAGLLERPERVTLLPADQAQVERHILSTSRATREGAAA